MSYHIGIFCGKRTMRNWGKEKLFNNYGDSLFYKISTKTFDTEQRARLFLAQEGIEILQNNFFNMPIRYKWKDHNLLLIEVDPRYDLYIGIVHKKDK